MAACSVQATLANILQRLRAVEDNQSRSNAAVAKLRLEMEDGLSRIQEVEFSHETALGEINSLMQRFGEQMKISRRKEQEKLRSAFARLREEMEEERNMCRLLKLQNKKLLKELEEATVAVADAGEELHRERRARELMEEVCNELAREIGEDKAEVEQLKHEHAKSKEKVEQELKMMRMASLWKDERVKTKILEVQRELNDRHRMDLSVADLKSRVEEYVSTLSLAGRESYIASANVHSESKDEKQKKNIIEQSKFLRCALEFGMRQMPSDRGGSPLHTRVDFEDEKIVTPFIEDECSQTSVCECCLDKVHEYERDESCSSVDLVDMQVRHKHSKKLCKHARRPQMGVEGDLFDHRANMITQMRKPLHESDVDSELDCSSRQTIMDSASVKENTDQKQLSLHLQGSQKSPEHSAGVWEDSNHSITTSLCSINACAEDDVSQSRMDDKNGFKSREQYRKCPASYRCTEEQIDATYLWKSPCQERPRMDEDQSDYNAKCSLHHHGCKDVNCVCADGANPCEDELGEFDGFYFEPVMAHDDLLRDDCRTHHREESGVNVSADASDHEDERGSLISQAYSRSTQQSRSPKELAHKSFYDGVKWTNANSVTISSSASHRDDGLPLSPPPPHKLVLPNLSAIRASSGKSHHISRGSASRSVSPSKAQVLQCFRPPPSSPEHESVKLLGPDSSKEVQHSGGSSNGRACLLRPSFSKRACSLSWEEEGARHVNVAHLEESSGSKMGISDERGNSLRAELIRARELDLQHTNYNVNTKATVPPLAPNKGFSPSFRFSPLRRSLTSSSQTGH